jgi:hypothetical protein
MDPALVMAHVVSAFPLGTLTAYGTPWPVGRHPSRLPVPDGIGRGLRTMAQRDGSRNARSGSWW